MFLRWLSASVRCSLVTGLISVFGTEAVAAPISANDFAEAVKSIKQVGPEGQGNAEASAAFQRLISAGPEQLIPVLATVDEDTSPRAANWLESAAETIAAKSIEQKLPLPAKDLEKFVLDRKHHPASRHLAFDLLVQADPTAPDRLVPGMLNDPSVELRRLSVERVIAEGEATLKAEKKPEALEIFKKAMSGARDDDQVQAIVKRLEELGEKVDLPKHFGFVTTWHLIGPFDNREKKGFNVAYPPEKKVDLAEEIEGKEGVKVKWTPYTTPDRYGTVDLAKAQDKFKGAISYAVAEFVSDKGQTVDVRLGTPNAWKVWVNGELIFAREEYHRGHKLDQYKMRARLKPGRNEILIKVCQNEQKEDWAQEWQFQLRICDSTGTAVLPATPATASAR